MTKVKVEKFSDTTTYYVDDIMIEVGPSGTSISKFSKEVGGYEELAIVNILS